MEHGTFVGWIGDDVLHSLYRIADLTVVPSIYEPFGLVALEAMASGCPCIVADTGGLREVVPHEEAGLRFTRARPRRARRGRRCASSATTSWAAGSSPKPTSTCVASTGPTSPSAPPRSTPTWRRRHAPKPTHPPARGDLVRLSGTKSPRLGSAGSSAPPGRARPARAQRSSFGASRIRITRAGMPATTAFAGTSLVTTELVPTIELSPTRTPRRMQAP